MLHLAIAEYCTDKSILIIISRKKIVLQLIKKQHKVISLSEIET